jgi:hypothetical protein
MKASLFLLALLVAGPAVAEPVVKDSSSKTNDAQRIQSVLVTLTPHSTNEIVHRPLVYSGAAVTAFKTRNPLQLVNPWATPEFSSGESKVSYDVLTGRPNGLKLFSVKF